MGIFEELDFVESQMDNELQNLEIEKQKKKEERKKLEHEMQLEDEKRRKNAKAYEIQKILSDTAEDLDEPHLYSISGKFRYVHMMGVDGGRYEEKEKTFDGIMTEREKRIAEKTGLEEVAKKWACAESCLELKSIQRLTRRPTEEEQIRLDAIKRKVLIIKSSKEANDMCVANFSSGISVTTSLKAALLSSLNVKTVDIEKEKEKKITTPRWTEELPEEKSKINLSSIKNSIARVLSKGER